MVADLAPDTTVRVDYLREGKPGTATVTVAVRPANAGLQEGEEDDDQGAPDSGESGKRLGITGRDVTPEIAEQLKLKVPTGAVITAVDPSGAAAAAGLQRGDVVHRVGRTEVSSFEELAAALKSAPNEGEVVLQVERGGRLAFVTVRLD
jgi:serine protease Do